MNVRELRAILATLDDDQPVVMDWYEGGPAILRTAHRANDGTNDLDSDDDLWVQS